MIFYHMSHMHSDCPTTRAFECQLWAGVAGAKANGREGGDAAIWTGAACAGAQLGGQAGAALLARPGRLVGG